MEIDYGAIGERVRRARNQLGLTQEQLVERTGLSNTHISNIETGHTKLSLPSLIKIANALSVTVDELLRDNITKSKAVFEKEMHTILSDCTDSELRVILPTAAALKNAMRKNSRKKD